MKSACNLLEPLLHAYTEGWLSASDRLRVEQHLRECSACRQKVADWYAVANALRELPTLPAPTPRLPAPEPEPRLVPRLALAMCPVMALLIAWHSSAWRPTLSHLSTYAPPRIITKPLHSYAHTMHRWIAEVQRRWKAF